MLVPDLCLFLDISGQPREDKVFWKPCVGQQVYTYQTDSAKNGRETGPSLYSKTHFSQGKDWKHVGVFTVSKRLTDSELVFICPI